MEFKELSLEDLKSDVKVEVIGADFVENGLDIDNIAVTPCGIFERLFRKDIIKVYKRSDLPGVEKLIFLDVCREGLYDALPQGLFHQSGPGKGKNVQDMLDDIKRNKSEEEAARNFFRTIEKELYRLRITSELEERKSILGFSDYYKSELYLNIWPDLNSIDDEYLPSLFQILPICHKITGNIELTEKVIEYIINEPVKLVLEGHTRKIANPGSLNEMGKHSLGSDFILGDFVPDFSPFIEIKIGPVPKSKILRYFNGGKVDRVIKLICDNLIPAEAEIKITVMLNNNDEKLILSDEKDDGLLGFTSRI